MLSFIFDYKKILLFLVLVNIVGFIYGIYFYYYQLIETPFYLWVFVLDSPIPVLLFALIGIYFLLNKKIPQILVLLSFFGLVKYGIWTVLVLLLFWKEFMLASPFIYSLNLPLHIGMIVEALSLKRFLQPTKKQVLAAFLFFFINDILDYFFGTLPYIPRVPDYLFIESIAVTFTISLYLYYKSNKSNMKHANVAGGVVLNKKGLVLVVNQKGDSWCLPKGHVDSGETEIEAAKREIKEESGITKLKFIKELGSYQRYRIGPGGKGEDKSELKTIHMFLFSTNKKKLKPIDKENPEARWVDKNKVSELLTHKKDKEFYNKIKEII